jgi:hypothetical protein
MTVCEIRLTSADVALLEDHLEAEIAGQEEVLKRLAEQEALLVRNDVAGLKRFLADSDPMLARLQTLTEMRLRIMSLLSRRLGVHVDACTVADVLDAADDTDRAALAALRENLRGVLVQVDRRTRRVNALLRQAADTNEILLHAILGDSPPARVYRPDGRRVPAAGLPHFTKVL